MRRTILVALLAAAVPIRVAPAQVAAADSAFLRGEYRAARTGYERVLARDSVNVRALYRLAILDSWDGELARSLARFARLRRLEPRDPDIMVAHARVLSWAGRYPHAEALYDTVLARWPGRADAKAGRARTVAWDGDLARAERLWRAALDAHPNDAEVLVGLAQTLLWKGQAALAESYAARARLLAPQDRAARDVLDLVRAALRPEIGTTTDYADDSDDNAFVAQQATFTTDLGRGVRGTVQAAWRRATDPFRDGSSYGGGGHVIVPLGHGAVLRAGLGARQLAPDSGRVTTSLTAQLGVGIRPARLASLGVAYTRTPFDETAQLIRRGFRVDAVDFSADVAAAPRVSVSAGGGAAWLSDGNRRLSAVTAVMVGIGGGVEVGAFARALGYREANPGRGYFAPGQFLTVEGRAVYLWRHGRWGARADAGLGTQQIGAGAPTQSEWHAGLTISRGWAAASELALTGSVTNSAASRTGTALAPGFKYWTLGLRLRQGL